MQICEKLLKFTEIMKEKMEATDVESNLTQKIDQVFAPT